MDDDTLEKLKSTAANIDFPMDLSEGLESFASETVFGENTEFFNTLRQEFKIKILASCIYTVYAINVLDSIKKSIQKDLPCNNLENASHKSGLRVGMIGCGQLGKLIIQILLNQQNIPPSNIFISTRRPESLDEYISLGISCHANNIRACEFAEFLILSLPYSQFHLLSEEIRGHIPSNCSIYSLLVELNREILVAALKSNNIYHLDVIIDKNAAKKIPLIENCSIIEYLNDEEKLVLFSPFNSLVDPLIQCKDTLPQLITHAAIALSIGCSDEDFHENLVKIQKTIFGKNIPMEEYFWVDDGLIPWLNKEIFLQVPNSLKPLTTKIQNDERFQQGFHQAFIKNFYKEGPILKDTK